jgi:hypothetical protein
MFKPNLEGALMADIFISYARQDRALAESLARDLTHQGYTVWWDAELVGADDFYEAILEALRQAKAAIVIWSKASAKSRFVRDEARFAMHLQKLITVRAPNLDFLEIPFGFQGQHTDDVSNRDQIYRAIQKLGIIPAAAGAGHHVKGGRLPATDIKAESNAAKEGDIELTKDNWQAFFYGFTLRVPKFQLSEQGTWTSIGAAITYIVLAIIIAAILEFLSSDLAEGSTLAYLRAFVFCVMAVFLWIRAGLFLSQRNFFAAIILSLASALQASLATDVILENNIGWTPTGEDKLLYFVGLLAIFLNLVLLRIRAYR